VHVITEGGANPDTSALIQNTFPCELFLSHYDEFNFILPKRTDENPKKNILNKGGELIEVDMLLDEKSSLIKISVSVHRLNTFREGALYELSGFDVTRSNNHFKLCNSNVAIRLNQSTKMVEVPAVANPR
ncbi:unnamed protein product, partial [Brassica napus]